MNIFIVTSKENLKIFKETLSKKYASINIQGTNNLMEGVESVSSKHITEEFDLFLIMSQRFIEEDLAHKRQISEKLNKSCVYALKDLPIYIMVNSNNKEYQEQLKSSLDGRNVKIYPYKKLEMSIIEEIIKEVLALTGTKKRDKSDVQRDIIAEKERKQKENFETHIDRIYQGRSKKDEEDFSRLSRIKLTIDQFAVTPNFADKTIQPQNSSKIISDIKNKLFDEKSILGDDFDESEIKIKKINNSILSEAISPNKLKERLMETNQEYNDYSKYMETLKGIIEKVKNSDEPNKHSLVIELIKEKGIANNEMNLILSEFLTELAKDSIKYATQEYSKDINELQEFGQYQDVDGLVGSKLTDIDELKKARGIMKTNVGYLVKQLTETSKLVSGTLTSAGNDYLIESKTIEEELKSYANENNIPLTELSTIKNNKVLKTLEEGYGLIKEDITSLITTSNNTIKGLVELVHKDEEIMDKQDEVIDVLMTQKTKKIITVDNVLQTKLTAIGGVDGVGKTHTAINMAMSESKMNKTLLVDLNIYNPNLIYYNNTVEITKNNRWQNEQTIALEEFIHIPISKYMYDELPYKNNLTIIQPKEVINLDTYEKIVNPSVFSLHLRYFLESLAQFYDKIIVILPYDLSQFGDLIKQIGVLYLVNDYDPINVKKFKTFMDLNNEQIDLIPIKHLIMNKKSRNIKIGIKEYLELCNIDTREFRYYTIPEFQESVQCKIEGKIPSEHNVNTRKLFDELIKR